MRDVASRVRRGSLSGGIRTRRRNYGTPENEEAGSPARPAAAGAGGPEEAGSPADAQPRRRPRVPNVSGVAERLGPISVCGFRVSLDFLNRAHELYNRTTGDHGMEISGRIDVDDRGNLTVLRMQNMGRPGGVTSGVGAIDFHTHPRDVRGERLGGVFDWDGDKPSLQDLINSLSRKSADEGDPFRMRNSVSAIIVPDGMLIYCMDPTFRERYLMSLFESLPEGDRGVSYESVEEAFQRGGSAALRDINVYDDRFTLMLVWAACFSLLADDRIGLSQFYQMIQRGKGAELDRHLSRLSPFQRKQFLRQFMSILLDESNPVTNPRFFMLLMSRGYSRLFSDIRQERFGFMMRGMSSRVGVFTYTEETLPRSLMLEINDGDVRLFRNLLLDNYESLYKSMLLFPWSRFLKTSRVRGLVGGASPRVLSVEFQSGLRGGVTTRRRTYNARPVSQRSSGASTMRPESRAAGSPSDRLDETLPSFQQPPVDRDRAPPLIAGDPASSQRRVWRLVDYDALVEENKLGQGSYGVVYNVRGEAVKPSCTDYQACLGLQGKPVKEGGPIWRVYSGEAVVGRNLTEKVPHRNVVRTEQVEASNPEQDLEVIRDGYDSANVTSELLKKWESAEGRALGDMENWMKDAEGREDVRRFIPHIVIQIAHALHSIRKRFPSFRHNDLHTGNVFLSTWKEGQSKVYEIGGVTHTVPDDCPRAVMIDFGVVTAKEDPEVRAIDTARDALDWLDLYQITDNPSQWYDILVFLADIQTWYGDEDLPIFRQVVDGLNPAWRGRELRRQHRVSRRARRGGLPDNIDLVLYGDEPREIRPDRRFYEHLDANYSFDDWLRRYIFAESARSAAFLPLPQ